MAADAREQILRAAVRTLSTSGYTHSTARAIASAGGFAPGVIYYHFSDLEDLFVATAAYASDQRMQRYRAMTSGVTAPSELLARLRALYREDEAEGHVAAVQELVAAAAGASRLAEQVRAETQRWQDFAETTIRSMLGDSPSAEILPVAELAAAAVGTYLGLEMLSHLHAERYGPEALFDAAERMVALVEPFCPGGATSSA